MSDPKQGRERRGQTQRLPEDERGAGGEARRTERLAPSGDEWSQREPVNPGWRSERASGRRASRRAGLPASPQEFQLWLQAGGWRYLAGIAVLLVVLLIALLAFGRGDQREAGVGFEAPVSTEVGAPVLGAGNTTDPAASQPSVTAAPPTTAVAARFVVTGTGTQGLFLRPEPSTAGAPLTTLPDGTVVEQIGEDVSGPDRVWRQVRAPDGQVGYVAVDFLTPAP